MTDRILRIGVWAAVSSQHQATDDKVSLEEQEAAGRRFAQAVGGEVVRVYRIPGHTRDIWNWQDAEAEMPAYRFAREDIEAGRLDVLHCVDSDRLGRDPALIMAFRSLARRHGCEVYDASMPHILGTTSMGHEYGFAVKSVAAGEEQSKRIARHRMGMRGRVKRGLFANNPPRGYEAEYSPDGELLGYVQNADAEIIRFATRLFLNGHSYAEIRRRLNDSAYQPAKGRFWDYKTIWDALHNDSYAGFPSWGSYRSPEKSDRYEAIWDAETFGRIIQERQRRKRAPYQRKGGGPLTGLIFCARCGYGMIRIQKRRLTYYRCQKHAKKSQHGDGVGCHANYTQEEKAITAVADLLRDLAAIPGQIDKELERIEARTNQAGAGADLQRAETQVLAFTAQRERLALAYAGGKMDLAVYRASDDTLRAQLEQEQERAGELRRYLDTLPDLEGRRKRLEYILTHYEEIMRNDEPATVAKRLQDAGIVVLCEEGEPIAGLQ